MATILNIAGHGLKRNGTFDPGASGYISQGEHRYYTKLFFEKLKKYQPKGADVVYHTDYNVYNYGNVVNLANSYGKDTKVIEWHFNGSVNENATKGHIIIYEGFNPDALDLRLRDGIESMVGVRNTHRGHKGIDGRSNLGNANRCAKGGVNYRLIELGFGTSPIDSNIMLDDMDKYAKKMTEAIFNTQIGSFTQQDSMAGYYIVKRGDTLWGISRSYNVTVNELKEWNNLDSSLIFPGQSLEVIGSDLPEPTPESKPTKTPKADPTNKIKVGDWVRVPAGKLYGSGEASSPVENRELTGQVETINYKWNNPIRLIKDGIYLGFVRHIDIKGIARGQDLTKIAREVISGKYGNATERKRRLEADGYDYDEVQKIVNRIVKTD